MNIMPKFVAFSVLLSVIYFTKEANGAKRCRLEKGLGVQNECMKDALQDYLSNNRKGRTFGVISLEPFLLPKVRYTTKNNLIDVTVTLNDMKWEGYSESNVTDVKNNYDGYTFVVETYSPLVKAKSGYEISGKLFDMPIEGRGTCVLVYEHLKTVHRIKAEFYENEGKKYMKVTEYKVELNPKSFTPIFDNLFDGHAQLSKEMRKIMIEKGDVLWTSGKSDYIATLHPSIKKVLNEAFQDLPLDEMFDV